MAGRPTTDPKDVTLQVRTPSRVAKMVDDLARHQILGTNKAEVIRNLLMRAIDQVNLENLIEKTLDARKRAAGDD